MTPRFTRRVLGKYDVGYHWCRACGLLQTEEPYWLDEAYATAIAALDTGIVQRNLRFSQIVAGLLYFSFDRKGAYVDVAGGYGLLTRLMRDTGFDFRWSDRYAQNLMARGFEARPGEPHEAVTAFEVLEHVRDPVSFLREALTRWKSGSVLFSTDLYRGDPPEPEAWWYYAFETGQHVSFYCKRTLEVLGEKLGLRLHSHANFHVLSERRIGFPKFQLLTGNRSRSIARYVKKRMRSRTSSDRRALQGGGPGAGDGPGSPPPTQVP